MNIIDKFFNRTAKINPESAIDYAFNISEELLKKKGIEDRDSLKNKLIEYAVQQGGNEQSLANFATQDKFLTFMRRMLIEMPNVSAPVQEEEKKETPEVYQSSEKDLLHDIETVLYLELAPFFPEKQMSYGEWSNNHSAIVSDIVKRTQIGFSEKYDLKMENALDLTQEAYWKVIKQEDNIL